MGLARHSKRIPTYFPVGSRYTITLTRIKRLLRTNECCCMHVECILICQIPVCSFHLANKETVILKRPAFAAFAGSMCVYFVLIFFLALLYGLFKPYCPCHTLLPLYTTGISTIVLSVKYQVIMDKSCLLDKAICSRTVLTA